MDLNKVGKFIANIRKEKALTQSELGDLVGVTDKTVSKWERGINAPDIAILTKLSNCLGVSVTELLNGRSKGNHLFLVVQLKVVFVLNNILKHDLNDTFLSFRLIPYSYY